MHFTTLTSILLPAMALAAPASLSARQDDSCIPTTYTISDFKYTTGASSSNPTVHFSFRSSFRGPVTIDDPASGGAICESTAATEAEFPNESVCSTGRSNLMFDLRAPVAQGNFQIIHQWQCNGQAWMSSTTRKISPMACQPSTDGTTLCVSEAQSFTPENVRRICSTPTCA